MYEGWSRNDLVRRVVELTAELSALRLANTAVLSEDDLEAVGRLVKAQQAGLEETLGAYKRGFREAPCRK